MWHLDDWLLLHAECFALFLLFINKNILLKKKFCNLFKEKKSYANKNHSELLNGECL